MKTKTTPETKTSAEWLHSDEFKNIIIKEPLGWDADNWTSDFYENKISLEEFTIRLLKSKIEIMK